MEQVLRSLGAEIQQQEGRRSFEEEVRSSDSPAKSGGHVVDCHLKANSTSALVYFGPILQAQRANVTSAISSSAAAGAMLVAASECIVHAVMMEHEHKCCGAW
jgi:hypothetical protein